MNKIVLITGASSGIGEACAHIFAENNWNLIITARRQERLKSLKVKLEEKGVNVLDLCFDVRNNNEVETHLGMLPEAWSNPDVLINNAGLAAGFGSIEEGNIEDWDQMIDTNVKGLLYVSRQILPRMKARKSGHVINIGSTAGKETYYGGNVYCATKHAVDSITKAMRIDLLAYGIKVTGICPGAAETAFSMVRFKGDEQKAKEVYKGYQPMQAKDIAEVIWYAANTPANVCLNDIVLTSLAQANSFYINRKH